MHQRTLWISHLRNRQEENVMVILGIISASIEQGIVEDEPDNERQEIVLSYPPTQFTEEPESCQQANPIVP